MPPDAQPPDDEALLVVVKEAWVRLEPYHKRWWDKARHYYALYRSYRGFRDEWSRVTPPDRDEFWHEARREWGTDLFIPHSYTIVETVVPRMLSNDPRIIVKPRTQASEQNAEKLRQLIDIQQARAGLMLTLQTTGKTGCLYGIGIDKTLWDKKESTQKFLRPGRLRKNALVVDSKTVTEFDDPDCIDIDPSDWFCDPMASSMKDAREVIHRSWRDSRYIAEMVKAKVWRNVGEAGDTTSLTQDAGTAWADRQTAGGYEGASRLKGMHEVWEYWNGEKVITVLDRERVVASGPNPHWHGRMPFHIFRPTIVPHELYGIGEIEPIEHLQLEVNMMRTQRRDNATLVLQRAFAVWEGAVDPDDVVLGPGAVIPVQGDPKDLIYPIPVGEIPASGYQEEAALLADFQRTSGISDQSAGGASDAASTSTATGAQLTMAALNVRIQNKTKRLELECIQSIGEDFRDMNQQRFRSGRQVRVDQTQQPGGDGQGQYGWQQINPSDVWGDFDIEILGGSTEPENVPQQRNDATLLWTNLKDNPIVDQRALLVRVLRGYGIDAPEGLLAPAQPEEPQVMQAALELLGQQVDPTLVADAINQARAQIFQAEVPGGAPGGPVPPGQNGGPPANTAGEAVGAPAGG